MSEIKTLRCVGGPLDGQSVACVHNYFDVERIDKLSVCLPASTRPSLPRPSRVRYVLDEKDGELVWLIEE